MKKRVYCLAFCSKMFAKIKRTFVQILRLLWCIFGLIFTKVFVEYRNIFFINMVWCPKQHDRNDNNLFKERNVFDFWKLAIFKNVKIICIQGASAVKTFNCCSIMCAFSLRLLLHSIKNWRIFFFVDFSKFTKIKMNLRQIFEILTINEQFPGVMWGLLNKWAKSLSLDYL